MLHSQMGPFVIKQVFIKNGVRFILVILGKFMAK